MKNQLEYEKIKGLIVFCNKCERNIHNKNKSKKCSHPIDKQVYKAIIRIRTGNGYKRKTNVLKARDFRTAFIEFKDYEYQVKNTNLFQQTIKPKQSQILKETMAMYIDYLNDADSMSLNKNNFSSAYIKRVTTHLKDFLRFIADKKINTNSFELSSINKSIIGMYRDYLETKNLSNYTYNDKIKTLRTFFNYLIDEEDYNLKNLWKKLDLKPERPTDISISAEDFYDLIDVISPDDAIQIINKTKRNMYQYWLKDLIRLKAFTGRRNAELFAMRWNMIHYDNDKPIYIKSQNIKVNKKNKIIDKNDIEYAYAPVGEELLELLNDLGLKENRYSDNYLIAPEVENRENIEKYASRYFSFFFKKLKRKDTRKLKHLRHTYITREHLFINGQITLQHANFRTTKKHYINDGEVAKWMVNNGFRVFDKKTEKTLQHDTPVIKKDSASLQSLDFQVGCTGVEPVTPTLSR